MGVNTTWTVLFVIAALGALGLLARGHLVLRTTLRRGDPEIPLGTIVMVAVGWATVVALVVGQFAIEIHHSRGFR